MDGNSSDRFIYPEIRYETDCNRRMEGVKKKWQTIRRPALAKKKHSEIVEET